MLTALMPALEGSCGWSQRLRFQVRFGKQDSLAGGGLRGMQEASCTSCFSLLSQRFLKVLNSMYMCLERQVRQTLNYECKTSIFAVLL